MHLRRLWLRDFRSHHEVDLELTEHLCAVLGPNGVGKSNLLEAVGYLALLESFRGAPTEAMVRAGAEVAIVRGEVVHGGREQLIEAELRRTGPNRVLLNRQRLHRSRDLLGALRVVVFAPDDLALVKGGPALRRQYLDQVLVSVEPRNDVVRAEFERAVRQRNALLKQTRGRLDEAAAITLEIFDEQLVALGAVLVAERLALVERLRPHLERAYAALVGADHRPGIGMRVSSLADAGRPMDDDAEDDDGADLDRDAIAARFAERLAGARARELDRGTTLIGPHRDDAVLRLNGLPARLTASHGESWSFALSLKLAAAELVRAESRTGDPVLILDDVFAELDADRRRRLGDAIVGFEQVLITCAVVGDIPEPMRERTIRIRAGEIVEEAA